MSNQFTGCECAAPTPDRCICDAMDRVVATSEAVTLRREDGRWIDPPALQAYLRRHNPDHNTHQPAQPGAKVMADGGEPQ